MKGAGYPLEHPALSVVIVWDTVPMTDATPTPEPPEHTGTSEATFGMKKAAQVAGISVSTIRRNKKRLQECGAEISPDGWKVPISALVASGLMRKQTPPDPDEGKLQSPLDSISSVERVRQLERDVLELKYRAELAEERQRSAEHRAQNARELVDALTETLKVERRMISSQFSNEKILNNKENVAEEKELESLDPKYKKSVWSRLFKSSN